MIQFNCRRNCRRNLINWKQKSELYSSILYFKLGEILCGHLGWPTQTPVLVYAPLMVRNKVFSFYLVIQDVEPVTVLLAIFLQFLDYLLCDVVIFLLLHLHFLNFSKPRYNILQET